MACVGSDGSTWVRSMRVLLSSTPTSVTLTLTVTATVRVLPWQECPSAIGSAARVEGMTLSDMRERIRGEFVGTSTCTHLNDTLRAIADIDALIDLRAR